MVFSSLRRRYNNLKDPPPQEKVGATLRRSGRSISTKLFDNDVQEESSSSSISKEEEEDAISTSITAKNNSDGFADGDPAVRDIPWTVRRIVSLHDDPTLPTITFRYFVLTFLFIIPGAFLSQMAHYRTTYAPYSIFFVQLACNYAGLFLARFLPAVFVSIPFTKRGFSLNPGPWSIKEHVLVTITAASGATHNLA
jgi:hypothetical protein